MQSQHLLFSLLFLRGGWDGGGTRGKKWGGGGGGGGGGREHGTFLVIG